MLLEFLKKPFDKTCQRCGISKKLPSFLFQFCKSCRFQLNRERIRSKSNPTWKPYDDFATVYEWFEDAGLTDIMNVKANAIAAEYWDHIGDFKQKLYNEHLDTLTQIERDQIKAGLHPSQSHSRKDEAEPVRAALKEHVKHLNYVEDVEFGFGQADELKLCVKIDRPRDLEQLQSDIPELFRGFEVCCIYDEKEPTFLPIIKLFPQ